MTTSMRVATGGLLVLLIAAVALVPVSTAPLPGESREMPIGETLFWQPIWSAGRAPVHYYMGEMTRPTAQAETLSWASSMEQYAPGRWVAYVPSHVIWWAYGGQLIALAVLAGGVLSWLVRRERRRSQGATG